MKDWIDIQAQVPRKNSPSEPRRENSVPKNSASETAVYGLPIISREIILMLFVGVMTVLGLQTHTVRYERHMLWRAYTYWVRRQRDTNAAQDRRVMIDDWAGGSPVHWRQQVRTRWLASKDINNSPDPTIRQAGFDAWYTRRAYSRVPGICISNIQKQVPQAGKSRLKAGNTLSAFTQSGCDDSQILIPP